MVVMRCAAKHGFYHFRILSGAFRFTVRLPIGGIKSERCKLGIFQRQPFAARVLEIDLHARIRAVTLYAGYEPFAEFLVEHALPDVP